MSRSKHLEAYSKSPSHISKDEAFCERLLALTFIHILHIIEIIPFPRNSLK